MNLLLCIIQGVKLYFERIILKQSQSVRNTSTESLNIPYFHFFSRGDVGVDLKIIWSGRFQHKILPFYFLIFVFFCIDLVGFYDLKSLKLVEILSLGESPIYDQRKE